MTKIELVEQLDDLTLKLEVLIDKGLKSDLLSSNRSADDVLTLKELNRAAEDLGWAAWRLLHNG